MSTQNQVKSKRRIRWIVETSIFLALIVILQMVTKPLGPLVTGSIVNFVLIAAATLVGMSSGIVIAVLSPILAFLLGVVPLPVVIIPVVIVGNIAIVEVFSLIIGKRDLSPQLNRLVRWIAAILLGAGIKFLALYAGCVWVVMPLVTIAQGTALKVPSAIISVSQIFTAVIGGVVAMLVVPPVRKAMRKS